MTEWPIAARLHLPIPPSTNNLFVTRGKLRVKSERYLRWINDAGKHIVIQRVPKLIGEVAVTLWVPRDNRRDADNEIKPVLDLLVRHQVIERDSMGYVVSIAAHVADREDVLVEIRQADVIADMKARAA